MAIFVVFMKSFMQLCHNWHPLNIDSIHEVNESEKLCLKLCGDQSASLSYHLDVASRLPIPCDDH